MRTDGPTDIASPTCVLFMHILQRTHETCFYLQGSAKIFYYQKGSAAVKF
jgi:hypothetical protein